MKGCIIICGYYVPSYTRYEANKEALGQMFELIDYGQTEVLGVKATINQALRIAIAARGYGCKMIYIYPYNYLLPIVLGLLRPFHKAKIVFDLYQSAVLSTWSYTHSRTATLKAWLLSFFATHLSDILLSLSKEYSEYYTKTLRVKASKLNIVMDGVGDEWVTQPKKVSNHKGTKVIYWGQYLPHHNLPLVISVAKALPEITFILCGDGHTKEKKEEIQALARGLENVVFKGRLPIEELINEVDAADIVLGHLKDISDTYLSAANKQIEGMVRGKPVITVWSKQREDLYKGDGVPLFLIRNPELELKDTILAIAGNQIAGETARSKALQLHSQAVVNRAMKKAINWTC